MSFRVGVPSGALTPDELDRLKSINADLLAACIAAHAKLDELGLGGSDDVVPDPVFEMLQRAIVKAEDRK